MISKDEVRHIANLAKLEFNENELDKMQVELSNILNYMDILNSIDVSDVDITYDEIISTNINVIRDDKKDEKFDNIEGILENTETLDNMVVIPQMEN